MRILFPLLLAILISSSLMSMETKTISSNNKYGGETILYKLEKDEHQHIVSKTELKDKKGSIRKIVYKFNDETITSKGLTRQIEYYNEDKVDRYEMFFSDLYSKESGVDKVIELLNISEEIIRTEYYLNDVLVFSEKNNAFSKKFRPLLISYCNSLVQSNYSEHLKRSSNEEFFTYEASVFKGKTAVKYMNNTSDLDAHDRFLLKSFLKMMNSQDMFNLYNKKVRVEENGSTYQVMIQDKVLAHMKNLKKNQDILLMYYYIGGYKDRVILAGIDYIVLPDQ